MAKVTLDKVKKNYEGGITAVKQSDLEIADKEFMVFVGPSGCGKSTTLRMIAGLEDISSGTVSIGDRVVNDVAPKDRDIAMVFQNYALYPHMTVYDNIAFSLKLRKTPKDLIEKRVLETADSLGLTDFLQRKPKALSGGQRQRVALGRAIVRNPAVFLLDEPLSNLDAKMRVVMRKELKLLHQRLKTTMIYVTHDQVEAMTLADRMCVMKDGLIQQVGKPLDVYDNPKNKFVAEFIGTPAMNIIEGQLQVDNGQVLFVCPGSSIKITDDIADKLTDYIGQTLSLGIRPENLIFHKTQVENAFHGTIEVIEKLGDVQHVFINIGSGSITASVDAHLDVQAGEIVFLEPEISKVHIFAGESGKNISRF